MGRPRKTENRTTGQLTESNDSTSTPEKEAKVKLALPALSRMQISATSSKLDKETLIKMVSPLRDILKGHTPEFTPNSDKSIAENILILKDDNDCFRKLTKDQLTAIYLSLQSEDKNFPELAKASPRIGKAWQMILNNSEITSAGISECIGHEMAVYTVNGWSPITFCEIPFQLLEPVDRNRYFYTGVNYNLTLDADARRNLIKLFMGKDSLEGIVIDKLPDDKNLKVMAFEKNIASDLAYFSGLLMSGSPLNANGTITPAKLKTLKKNMISEEFLPSAEKWPIDRIELLTIAYFLNAGNKNADDTTVEVGKFARFVTGRFPKMITGAIFTAFLPAFKGFTKSWASDTNVARVIRIIESLLKPAAKGWMSLSNLNLRYICSDESDWKSASSSISIFTNSEKYKSTIKRKDDNLGYSDSRSMNIRWFDEVDFPFVVHWIKFLCGAGILEIAMDMDSSSRDDDATEGIRYVRLTPLGRYAFKIDGKYESPAVKAACTIDIDEFNGIITVIDENCPFILFLQKVTKPIGGQRFRITPEALINGCDSREDVERRIMNLKSLFNAEQWKTLEPTMEEALRRTKCSVQIPDYYSMIKIKQGVPELMQIIASNPRIRANSLLAEDSVILIKRGFYSEFIEILQDNGYLLN